MIKIGDYTVGILNEKGHLITLSEKDTFRVPFDSEYSIQVKNKGYRRTAVEILVDGTLILGDAKATLEPNGKVVIDRFCIDGNLKEGNKLKFVSKDDPSVQDPSSEKNGNIEVRFYPEKYTQPTVGLSSFSVSFDGPTRGFGDSLPLGSNISNRMGSVQDWDSLNLRDKPKGIMSFAPSNAQPDSFGLVDTHSYTESIESIEECLVSDAGATVEGKESNQSFEEGFKLDINEKPDLVASFYLKAMLPRDDKSVEGRIKSKICIVLDKSGSMSSVRSETIEAINNQLRVLRESPENVEAKITWLTFNEQVDEPFVFDRKVSVLGNFTKEDYIPNGGTAMLDGVGKGIELMSNLDCAHEKNTAFLVIVISDGEENSSKIYDYEDISSLIADRQSTGRWTFSYLGANQDLSEVSRRMNIHQGNVQVFTANSQGMKKASRTTGAATKAYTSSLSQGDLGSQCYYSSVEDEETKP